MAYKLFIKYYKRYSERPSLQEYYKLINIRYIIYIII